MIRSALVSLIELESDLDVVGVAGRGDHAVERIVELRPDVAVLDIDMPGVDGLTAAAQLAERVPRCAALICSPRPGRGSDGHRRRGSDGGRGGARPAQRLSRRWPFPTSGTSCAPARPSCVTSR